jgi:hypothetical protein
VLLVLACVILASEAHKDHGHILLSDGSGNFQTTISEDAILPDGCLYTVVNFYDIEPCSLACTQLIFGYKHQVPYFRLTSAVLTTPAVFLTFGAD